MCNYSIQVNLKYIHDARSSSHLLANGINKLRINLVASLYSVTNFQYSKCNNGISEL